MRVMIFDDLDTARTGEDRQEDAIPMFAQEDPVVMYK